MKKKPDGRKNNGGHPTGGRKSLPNADKKQGIPIYLSENEFKKEGWESIVCDQFKEKFENKLKTIMRTEDLNKVDEFTSELIFAVQNSKYVKINSALETITIRMIDYRPTGESTFEINREIIKSNFKKWAEKIHKRNFNEIIY